MARLSDELQRKLAPWADKAEGRRSTTSTMEEALRATNEKPLPGLAANRDIKTLLSHEGTLHKGAVRKDIDLENSKNENVTTLKSTSHAAAEKVSGETKEAKKAREEEIRKITEELERYIALEASLRKELDASKKELSLARKQVRDLKRNRLLPAILAFIAVFAGTATFFAMPGATVRVVTDPVHDDSVCASRDNLQKKLDELREFMSFRGPIRQDPGKCWDGPPFTPEICCSPWFGKDGHPGCWTAEMNFQRCCSKHWSDASLVPK